MQQLRLVDKLAFEQSKRDARLIRFHRAKYTQEEAAEALGVTKRTVQRWSKRLGLTRGRRA